MKTKPAIFCATLFLLPWICGCGGGDSNADSSSTGGGGPSHVASSKLVGVWFGQATLDTQTLSGKLEAAGDVQAQQAIRQAAGTFLGTQIAMLLDADGTMEIEAEMKLPDGQVIRDAAIGRWSIVSQNDRSVVIEIVENMPDGTTEVSRKQFDFHSDNDHFTMNQSVSSELADCRPMVVFERQDMSDTDIARNPGTTNRQ